MNYNGCFTCFDFSKISTYPIGVRSNKVTRGDIMRPETLLETLTPSASPQIDAVATAVLNCRKKKLPVILFTGAHLIKNGLSLLIRSLIEKQAISLIATTGAGLIHDLELALIGETSENVPNALPRGQFGMSRETGETINRAFVHGNSLKLGAGETFGRLMAGESFPDKIDFQHTDLSLIQSAHATRTPCTIHATIGADITDQHPTFDGEAKGGCSARDFSIFAAEVARMTSGGVFINIGSAVTGPEIFLKACSMAANVGSPPSEIITADFDIRPISPDSMEDERNFAYYFRDHKSVVNRIPQAFNGRGYYIQGDHLDSVPAFYRKVMEGMRD